MSSPAYIEIPKIFLTTLNQLYEVERKLALHGDVAGILRNIARMKDAFAAENLFYEDPMGQPFSETRADLEASIAGESTENLVVAEVIKPVIRHGTTSYSRVIQKGIVVVHSKNSATDQNNDKGVTE